MSKSIAQRHIIDLRYWQSNIDTAINIVAARLPQLFYRRIDELVGWGW